MNRNSTRRGFTLIELLVVVIIIGVLAAIALPQYQKAVRKARLAEAKLTLKAIWDAQQRKNLEMGTENEAYHFGDLDVSFADLNDNVVTGSDFCTKDFCYNLVTSPGFGGFAVRATPQRDNSYFLHVSVNSAGAIACGDRDTSAACQLLFPGATEVDRSSFCSSCYHCYVE